MPFANEEAGCQGGDVRILEKVRIPSATSRFGEYPHRFSDSMRRRVMIAMAPTTKPKLLIADKPTTALNVTIQGQILDLIETVQEDEGTSVLFISHDMAVVERVSHRVAVMYLDEIVEIGPRAAVFGNPQHSYTKRLMSAVPVPDPDRRRLKSPAVIEELKSPIRPLDYKIVPPVFREISPGHLVAEN